MEKFSLKSSYKLNELECCYTNFISYVHLFEYTAYLSNHVLQSLLILSSLFSLIPSFTFPICLKRRKISLTTYFIHTALSIILLSPLLSFFVFTFHMCLKSKKVYVKKYLFQILWNLRWLAEFQFTKDRKTLL